MKAPANWTHFDNWFSNFIPFKFPIMLDGQTFKTPEHFFQAMKILNPDDRKEISESETPGKAKRLGRKCKLRSDWDEIKQDVMEFTVLHRVQTDDNFKGALLATGDEEIVEWNNWGDQSWGKTLDGIGENRLGKILMKVRDEIIND